MYLSRIGTTTLDPTTNLVSIMSRNVIESCCAHQSLFSTTVTLLAHILKFLAHTRTPSPHIPRILLGAALSVRGIVSSDV